MTPKENTSILRRMFNLGCSIEVCVKGDQPVDNRQKKGVDELLGFHIPSGKVEIFASDSRKAH